MNVQRLAVRLTFCHGLHRNRGRQPHTEFQRGIPSARVMRESTQVATQEVSEGILYAEGDGLRLRLLIARSKMR